MVSSSDDAVTLLCGDARAVLDTLPAQSVHTCITSPSYYGLRDYGCTGQIGLESTPQEYVAALVDVFRGVKRVLRDDGTCWVVLGDSYNSGAQFNHHVHGLDGGTPYQESGDGTAWSGHRAMLRGVKPKSLLGIPWRVAFALQDDGWLLRQELIWHKPNPMPESVKDRCTRAHETVFMLAKGPRYFFDHQAIAEECSGARPRMSGVVERANLRDESIICGNDLGPENEATVGTVSPTRVADTRRLFEVAVGVATAILDGAQREDQFSLPVLDTQVGQEHTSDHGGVAVGGAPPVHRAALLATRFLSADMPPKDFLEQVDRLGVALPECDVLGVAGRVALGRHAPRVNGNTDAAVRIDHAGKVGQDNGVRAHYQEHIPTAGRKSCEGGSSRAL